MTCSNPVALAIVTVTDPRPAGARATYLTAPTPTDLAACIRSFALERGVSPAILGYTVDWPAFTD